MSFLVPFSFLLGTSVFDFFFFFFELLWSLFASPIFCFFSFLNQRNPSFLKRLIIFSAILSQKKKTLIFEYVFELFKCFTSLLYSILVSPIFLLLLRLKEYLFFERFFRWIFPFFCFIVFFLFFCFFSFSIFCAFFVNLPFQKHLFFVFFTLCIPPFFLSSFFHHVFAFIFSYLLFNVFHSPFFFSQRENIFFSHFLFSPFQFTLLCRFSLFLFFSFFP